MAEATFKVRAWGDGTPTVGMLADELERIAAMVRTGFSAGDAMLADDFDGKGWWDMAGFAEPEDNPGMVECECGADVDTSIFGECHACGRSVVE